MIAAAAMAAERRVIRGLQDAGAVSGETAVELEGLRPFDRRRLERLLRIGVVCRTEGGRHYRYYIDTAGLAAWQQRRHRVAAVVLVIVVLAAGVLIAFLIVRQT